MNFDYVVKIDAMFCYCWFIMLCQFYVSTVLIYAMLNSPAALSNLNTYTFARDAVNARCSQSYGFFEGWQVAGYLPVGKGDTFDIL